MRHEEIKKYNQHVYQENCDVCSQIINISTKKNDDAEFYTNVYVQCDCGNWIEFEVSIN